MSDATPEEPVEDDNDDDTVVVTNYDVSEHKVEKSGIPVYLPDGNRFARGVISDGGHYIELFIAGEEPIGALLLEGLIGLGIVYMNQEAQEAVHSAKTQGEN